jgi:hypothetical protein
MKIYEGTDGLRGLVKKLIEVYDFKKVVFEGDNASIDTQNVTFQLWVTDELFLRGQFTDTEIHGWSDLRTEAITCPFISITSGASDTRRWVIYKQSDILAFGIDNNTFVRPDINAVVGEVIDYETQEKGTGMTTSCAQNRIDDYAVFTDGMSILSTPYRYAFQQKSVTSLIPVLDTNQNKGFTNVYHILSHSSGTNNSTESAVPTQTILLNDKKYLLSRFAFEIKE